MAYSYNRHVYDGATTDYDLSFAGGYRTRSDISAVRLASEEYPSETVLTFDWLSPTRIRLDVTPLAAGERIEFRRTVSKVVPPVDLMRPGNLTREAVTAVAVHALQVCQEIMDGRIDDWTLINEFLANAEAYLIQIQESLEGAEEAAAEAAASAAAAIRAAQDAAQAAEYTYAAFNNMMTDTRSFIVGSIIQTRLEGYSYRVVASGGHLITAGGVQLVAQPRQGRYEPEMFQTNANPGVTNMTAGITQALNLGKTRLGGTYRCSPLVVAVASDIEWNGVVNRHTTAGTGNFWVFNNDVTIVGFGKLDLNKENTTTGCHGIRVNSTANKVNIAHITVRGAKAVNGWGDGINISTGQSASSDIRVTGVTCEDNDGSGLSGPDVRNCTIRDGRFWRNGQNGILLNNFDTTFAQKIRWTRVINNYCSYNTRSGIGIGNFIVDNVISGSGRVFGFDNMEATDITIEGNTCEGNLVYGIAVAALGVSVIGNTVRRNGTEGAPNGGILCNSRRAYVNNNVSEYNIGYGIDMGGSDRPSIIGNVVAYNTGTALSVECTILAYVQGNKFMDNGSAGTSETAPGSTQIHTWKVGGDGNGNWFPSLTTQPHIIGNQFILASYRIGIRLDDGLDAPIVADNVFWTDNPNLAVRDFSLSSVLRNNRARLSALQTLPLVGTTVTFPDIFEEVAINPPANTVITGIRTDSMRLVGTGVATIDVTNAGGSGYTEGAAAVITGGGGSGAAAIARVRNGALLGFLITARGTGYTSPPTVTVPGGTGATIAAQVGKKSPGQDKPLSLLTFEPCTLAGAAADGPNVLGIPPGNTVMPANGIVQLRGRGEQWRVASKNF